MNEKEHKLWGESIKAFAEKSGKTVKQVQDLLPMRDMEIASKIRIMVKQMHSLVLEAKQPKAQLLSAIMEILSPFPKDIQLEMLLELVKKLDEINEFIEGGR